MMMPMMMVMSNDDDDDAFARSGADAGQDERQCMLGSRMTIIVGFGTCLRRDNMRRNVDR